MQLIGMLDSPFVRRVAVTAHVLNIPFEHRAISIFRDYDAFRDINPLVKVPTWICDDGQVLVDSTLIIGYLESLATDGPQLMPQEAAQNIRALQMLGTSLVAMEKVAALIYERKQRPEEKQHAPWIERIEQQLQAAVDLLESHVDDLAGETTAWRFGPDMTQPDITLAIAWRFVQHVLPKQFIANDYPALQAFSARAEAQPAFVACPLSQA